MLVELFQVPNVVGILSWMLEVFSLEVWMLGRCLHFLIFSINHVINCGNFTSTSITVGQCK